MTKQRAFAIAAAISWFYLALSLTLTAFNVYPPTEVLPHAFGDNSDGIAGFFGRIFDWFSYFTILSNIVVAVVTTMLARSLHRTSTTWATLRMDSLVMISVTGLVYAIVLAPGANPQGLEILTNSLGHYIIPALTVVLWLLIGPRKQLRPITIFTALIIPIIWAVYTLIRGAFINGYPYGFLNVAEIGLGPAIINIIGVAVLGMVIGAIYWLIDKLLPQRSGMKK